MLGLRCGGQGRCLKEVKDSKHTEDSKLILGSQGVYYLRGSTVHSCYMGPYNIAVDYN
jgi:hypothetical protein